MTDTTASPPQAAADTTDALLAQQAYAMIRAQDLSHWSDAHDRVVLDALRAHLGTLTGPEQLQLEPQMTLPVGGETRALFIHGTAEAVKACNERMLAGAADAARLDKLEELALEGIVTLAVEVDGGVLLSVEPMGEAARAYRDKNSVRDAIDAERRGEAPGLSVPRAVTQPEPRRMPTPEKLLEVSRQTGLRSFLHGVPPVVARDLLARFFEAASDPKIASAPVEPPPKVQGIKADGALVDDPAWMRLSWWRDEIHRQEAAQSFIRMELLNEEQARANHGLGLERLRGRGGITPNEALAIVRRVPCRPSISEEDAFRALVAAVQRVEGASA